MYILVRDVRSQVSKLDPKSLNFIFMGYSRVQKGIGVCIGVFNPLFDVTLCLLMLKLTIFPCHLLL